MTVCNYHAMKEETPAAVYVAESNYEDEYGNSEVNFTNRRLKENSRGRVAYRGGYRQRDLSGKGSLGDSRGMNKHNQGLFNFRNKCFVCEQNGCRAWKHDKGKRLDARKRWKSRSSVYITASLDAQDEDEDNTIKD
ncbi:hypothetical protein GcM1_210026 [Golovinomyces cichoracearum]|uniref:Uncharacterized protein n=1 Tax=Golovinomyces cichoracearum TaxID=62708 RepID=A0A420IVL2_9PEZI|nr:hypothetical protein GcM1_210026 [Golovinomyces cichoracearum]